MTNVTMKAVDTLHISSVGQHSLQAGDQFEVSNHVADDLEKRGLATRVVAVPASASAPGVKAAPPALNKMARAPLNKSISA